MPKRVGVTRCLGSRSIEPRQQVLEGGEGTHLAVELEGLAQGIADARMNGGRRHLHEALVTAVGPIFPACIQRFHGLLNVRS